MFQANAKKLRILKFGLQLQITQCAKQRILLVSVKLVIPPMHAPFTTVYSHAITTPFESKSAEYPIVNRLDNVEATATSAQSRHMLVS